MNTYDAIVVLGSQPDYQTWEFPSHVYASLDRAIELFNQGAAPYIALSGDHALKFDHTGVVQPFKEADKLEAYVLSKGVPADKVLKETQSLDTVANFYYLKNLVFKPHDIHSVLLITADFRVTRIKFLWQKVVGPDYPLSIETVPFDQKDIYTRDLEILERQKAWLKDVADGDDSWFADKFYDDPYYRNDAAEHKASLTTEPDERKRYMI